MALPTPGRAAASAGILIALAVLLLGADLAVVRATGEEVAFIPFTVDTGNSTTVGMRVTNAGPHDVVSAYEMFASAACGQAYRSPIRVGPDGTYSQADAWVGGPISFTVLESRDTADFLRGQDVPLYHQVHRDGPRPENLTLDDGGDEGEASQAGDRIVRTRIVVVCASLDPIVVERGSQTSPHVRVEIDSANPWVADLPRTQGVDFLYTVDAREQPDNETYALLASDLQRGAEFWQYTMRLGSVVDERARLPDAALRILAGASLAAAIACLALAFRREPPEAVGTPTDVALAVAFAGERHLLRLRRTWGLVGALLVPLLAAATYAVFSVSFSPPTPHWGTTILVGTLALDACVLALWLVAALRSHRDLVAWRNAWTRMDRTALDDL